MVHRLRRFLQRPLIQLISGLMLIGLVMVWRSQQSYPLFDTYPLYYGAQAFWETGNAYELNTVIDYKDVWSTTNAQGEEVYPYKGIHEIGNAYPLPAVLLWTPWSLLPHPYASILWLGFLVAGVLWGLTLLRAPWWWLFYWPLLEGLRLEQYTVLILMVQLFALAVWLRRDDIQAAPWLIAGCCMIMLTKPTQGFIVALLFLWLIRDHWKAIVGAFAMIWGVSFLLDPNWLWEWFAAQEVYALNARQVIPWPLLLCIIPLIRNRNWLGTATVAQLALFPYTRFYPSMSLMLSILRHRLSFFLVLLSDLWLIVIITVFPNGPVIIRDICTALVLAVAPLMLVQYDRSAENQAALIKLDPQQHTFSSELN